MKLCKALLYALPPLTALAMVSCTTFTTLPAEQAMPLNNMTVAHSASTQISDQEADTVLAEVQKILTDIDGPDDTACPVQAKRTAPVFQYNSTIEDINSDADFNALLKTPGYIKVVRTINFCGKANGGIVGCSHVPGGGIVVLRQSSSQLEGSLWTHEYGHNMGLFHVCEVSDGNCTPALSVRVMYPMLSVNGRQVSAGECNAYKRINLLTRFE